jgi:hypothetical protein
VGLKEFYNNLSPGNREFLLSLVLLFAFVSSLIVIKRYSKEVLSAVRGIFAKDHWPLILHIVLYFVLAFVRWENSPQFNFPRYLIPTYPFIIVFIVVSGYVILRNIPSILVRISLLVFLAAYIISNLTGSVGLVSAVQTYGGRGVERNAVRNHPAISYLCNEIQNSDLIYSTDAPTLWYYLRRRMFRLDGMQNMNCLALAQPESGGRTIFVLFPHRYYYGDPTDPAEIVWFENWIQDCGTLLESKVFDDTVVHIVAPLER